MNCNDVLCSIETEAEKKFNLNKFRQEKYGWGGTPIDNL